jgi:hypothetical protein
MIPHEIVHSGNDKRIGKIGLKVLKTIDKSARKGQAKYPGDLNGRIVQTPMRYNIIAIKKVAAKAMNPAGKPE